MYAVHQLKKYSNLSREQLLQALFRAKGIILECNEILHAYREKCDRVAQLETEISRIRRQSVGADRTPASLEPAPGQPRQHLNAALASAQFEAQQRQLRQELRAAGDELAELRLANRDLRLALEKRPPVRSVACQASLRTAAGSASTKKKPKAAGAGGRGSRQRRPGDEASSTHSPSENDSDDELEAVDLLPPPPPPPRPPPPRPPPPPTPRQRLQRKRGLSATIEAGNADEGGKDDDAASSSSMQRRRTLRSYTNSNITNTNDSHVNSAAGPSSAQASSSPLKRQQDDDQLDTLSDLGIDVDALAAESSLFADIDIPDMARTLMRDLNSIVEPLKEKVDDVDNEAGEPVKKRARMSLDQLENSAAAAIELDGSVAYQAVAARLGAELRPDSLAAWAVFLAAGRLTEQALEPLDDSTGMEEALKPAKEASTEKAMVEAEPAVNEIEEQADAGGIANKKAEGGALIEVEGKMHTEAENKADKKLEAEAEIETTEEAHNTIEGQADTIIKAKDKENIKKATEEAPKNTAKEQQKKAAEETQKKAAERAEKKAAEEAQKKAAEKAEKKAAERAEEAHKKAAEETQQKAAEEEEKTAAEEAQKKAAEKAEKAEKKAAEEAQKKAAEKAEKKAAEEAQQKAAEEEEKNAEEDAKKKAAEKEEKKAAEAAQKAAEEAQKKAEKAKKKAAEEAQKKAEEKAQNKKESKARKKAKEEESEKAEQGLTNLEESETTIRMKAEKELKNQAKLEPQKKSKNNALKKSEVDNHVSEADSPPKAEETTHVGDAALIEVSRLKSTPQKAEAEADEATLAAKLSHLAARQPLASEQLLAVLPAVQSRLDAASSGDSEAAAIMSTLSLLAIGDGAAPSDKGGCCEARRSALLCLLSAGRLDTTLCCRAALRWANRWEPRADDPALPDVRQFLTAHPAVLAELLQSEPFPVSLFA